jgi:hypothetical protein
MGFLLNEKVRDASYITAKAVQKGGLAICPTCLEQFSKKRGNQVFCSGSCKDYYWNQKKKNKT